MDTVTKYRYACGTSDQLAEGDLDNLSTSDSIEDLDMSESGLIVVPKFVGVYQTKELQYKTQLERENKEDLDKFFNVLSSSYDEKNRDAMKLFGITEQIDPRLIHVGFDQDVYDRGLVCLTFKGRSHRLAFSPCNNMPNFPEKHTELLGIYVQQMTDELKNDDTSKEKLIADCKRAYGDLNQMLRTYGLTREEYGYMRVFDKLSTELHGIKIMTGPEVKLLSSFLHTIATDV